MRRTVSLVALATVLYLVFFTPLSRLSTGGVSRSLVRVTLTWSLPNGSSIVKVRDFSASRVGLYSGAPPRAGRYAMVGLEAGGPGAIDSIHWFASQKISSFFEEVSMNQLLYLDREVSQEEREELAAFVLERGSEVDVEDLSTSGLWMVSVAGHPERVDELVEVLRTRFEDVRVGDPDQPFYPLSENV